MAQKIPEDISEIIYEHFDGQIDAMTINNIKELYKKNDINKSQHSFLKKIIKYTEKNPNYKIKLPKRKTPKIEETSTSPVKKNSKEKSTDSKEYVSIQRKAFIDWLNKDFYQNIFKQKEDTLLNIQQIFVKNYLSLDAPYRGLLVYHGLGSGKTATAISTAEGLSENMNITTLLPASLETNFINEVKTWGENTFNINKNKWTLISESNIDDAFMKNIYESNSITQDIIDNIHTRAKNLSKDKSLTKGYWIISDDGESLKNLSKSEQIYLELQIEKSIKLKYNFIHYNPFPKVTGTSFEEFLYKPDNDDDIFNFEKETEEQKTNNKMIVEKLEKKLEKNLKEHNINSPFYNEVIIIDEVHNFVRQITNNNTTSILFYEWILNSKNTKLICLSGTPIINKPCEIAILFNMIRGMTRVYNFTIKFTDKFDEITLSDKLKDIFYKEHSPVYQIQVKRHMGKFLISFMQNTTKFKSIMNSDNKIIYSVKYRTHDFKEFIEHIYSGLHKLIDDEDINPSKKTLFSISEKNLKEIILGKEVIYDTDLNIKFNRYRPLFTINYNDRELDLTDNNDFMNYFFEGSKDVPDKKKTLLKRMLLGLVSYYPNDRKTIISMPEVVIPVDNEFKDSDISKKTKIELCEMSQIQFEKYKHAWVSEKEKQQLFNKTNMYLPDDKARSTYQIYTRRVCNMAYNNETFRTVNKKSGEYLLKKNEEYDLLKQNDSLIYNKGLQYYSPKFNKILSNISKYIKDGSPTGKVLFYSDFRQDAGSEIFELVLHQNGYSKYDHTDVDKTKKLRYTFITGLEKEIERSYNKEAFNLENNKFGEYIQIMIISSAGAEGISLFGIRQVHILEPFWNYIRIEQVYGRANRIESHKQLTPNNRNIEQYLYICVFPEGNTVEQIYKSIDRLGTWTMLLGNSKTNISNIEKDLFDNYKNIYDHIQNIISIRTESQDTTVDEVLFDIMNKKLTIANKISDVIKEASVDCLQNTRDDFNIHQGCVEFDKSLQTETSYFPGINANDLYLTDKKQLLLKQPHSFIEPDIYIVPAIRDSIEVSIYYKLNKLDVHAPDIRYIQDQGKQIGILNPHNELYYKYIKEHPLDNILGSRLSVFQELYKLDKSIIDEINDYNSFPELSKIITNENLLGYIIKFNISETLYFKFNDNKPIVRLYDYKLIESNNFKAKVAPIIVHDKRYYKVI